MIVLALAAVGAYLLWILVSGRRALNAQKRWEEAQGEDEAPWVARPIKWLKKKQKKTRAPATRAPAMMMQEDDDDFGGPRAGAVPTPTPEPLAAGALAFEDDYTGVTYATV